MRGRPEALSPRRLRFDLHVHSSYSDDGKDGVEKILDVALRKRLDGISITDHDTLEGSFAARRLVEEKGLNLVVVQGAEVSTSEGHLLALGIEELPLIGRSPEETIEAIHRQGGIAIVPHPYHLFRHAIFRIPDCDAVEVYNSKHLLGVANAWARRVAKRRGLPMVAGSDAHIADTVGLGVTVIYVEDGDVLEAIRAGRVKIEGRRTPPWVFVGQMERWVRRHVGWK
ncbi:MAG: PHP domain-containing protein [Methanotrichaceae archaeon]